MTLQEVRDTFLATLEVEKAKRGIGSAVQMNIEEKLIAFWMSQAQMDILQKLKPNRRVQDYTFSPNVNTYALPLDFGMDYSVEIEGAKLDKTPLMNIQTLDGDTALGTPSKYSVLYSGTYVLVIIPTPQIQLTGRVWYYDNPGLYSPSLGQNQYWGTFDGSNYSGVLRISDEFVPALLKHMLSQIFDDMKNEYRGMLRELKEIESAKVQTKIKYRFGVKRI